MNTLHRIADRFPRAKALAKAMLAPFRGKGVSSDYAEIAGDEVAAESARLRGAWLEADLPARQRELVEKQLAAHRGISVNKLIEEWTIMGITEFDAESRFRARAASGSREHGLAMLAELDRRDRDYVPPASGVA